LLVSSLRLAPAGLARHFAPSETGESQPFHQCTQRRLLDDLH